MLRIRFHGRGGHGVKTASRIAGTAAFLHGLEAQDFPVYGAERRGAAVAAFTRIDTEPICERGAILVPDLVVVADETLLADPAAGVLAGAGSASAVFINSPRDASDLAARYAITAPVQVLDLTALGIEFLGRGTALSAGLGAAACALTGMIPQDRMLAAVREELAELKLYPDALRRNVELVRQVFAQVEPTGHAAPSPPSIAGSPLRAPSFVPGPEGVPILYAAGNSTARHTGAWRIVRPVIDCDRCTRCGLCAILCPDGAIALDAQRFPVIDYDHCKGCLICSEICPLHCIAEEKEVAAW
jgi:pyruvate ferredoxin oxidoreductase gamma subunit